MECFKWPSHLVDVPPGAVAGDFAADRFLALPCALRLLDLQIFNDLNLPHLQQIFEAFMQPARRNGEYLLARILPEAGQVITQEPGEGAYRTDLAQAALDALLADMMDLDVTGESYEPVEVELREGGE